MNWRLAVLFTVVLLGTLVAPTAAEWRCRQGRVELIVGGTQGCLVAPPPAPAGTVHGALNGQPEFERRNILVHELRQEQAVLAGFRRNGWPADPAIAQRVQDNINALLRELSRTSGAH